MPVSQDTATLLTAPGLAVTWAGLAVQPRPIPAVAGLDFAATV